jgi:FkbM family methyltransferase
MKSLIKLILQKILGLSNYLFVFSIFISATLKHNRKEGDFLHFLSLLPDNSLVLDIGANIGVMTIHMGRKLPKATVYSFEPLPANLHNLRKLVKFFNLKNVKVFETALGNYEGTASIILPEENHVKMQGLTHVEGVEGSENSRGMKFEVPMHRLDDIPELLDPKKPLSGIKLDVENYEFQVLEGATRLIYRYKPIIYTELWDNQNRSKCFQMLNEAGYRTFILEKGNLIPYDSLKHTTQNFFFLHPAYNS